MSAHSRLWIAAGVGLALDLWSKQYIFESLKTQSPLTVIPGFLQFQRSLNPGAVFGLGAGYVMVFIVASALALAFVLYLFAGSAPRQRGFHIVLGMILAGALGNLYDRTFILADVLDIQGPNGSVDQVVGVVRPDAPEGMVRFGHWPDGTSSRLVAVDQIVQSRRQGVVRDFIRLVPSFPRWVPYLGGRNVWPWVFNVADSLLVVGVLVLMINFWFGDSHPNDPIDATPAPEGSSPPDR